MSKINPELEPGDRVLLLHMDGEALHMGSKGTVVKKVNVPFGLGHQYTVKWDNGSILDLLPDVDSWVLANDNRPKKEYTNESFRHEIESLSKHKDILQNVDYRKIMDYLEEVRKSGVVNMFQATPFLTTDSKNLHKLLYRVGAEPEDHPILFELVDDVRNILIQEVVRIMKEKITPFDDSTINRVFEKLAEKMMEFYFSLYETYMSNTKK